MSTIVAESLDAGYDGPAVVAQWLSPVAHRYQFGDGVGMVGWLLDLAGAADRDRWIAEATEGAPVSCAKSAIATRTQAPCERR